MARTRRKRSLGRSTNGRSFLPRRASLDEWVRFIATVYFDANEEMEPVDLWMQVVNDSCILAEHVRKGELKEAEFRIVKMFGWMASFVGKYLYSSQIKRDDPIGDRLRFKVDTYTGLNESYGKWILEKYPESCSKCGYPQCHCAVHRKAIEERRQKKEAFDELELTFKEQRANARQKFEKKDGKPTLESERVVAQPIDSLVTAFIAVYGSGHYDSDIWKIAAHLQEEVGEVSLELMKITEIAWYKRRKSKSLPMRHLAKDAVQRKADEGTPVTKEIKDDVDGFRTNNAAFEYLMDSAVEKLKEELADVFTWLTAMLHKIDTIRQGEEEEPRKRTPFWEHLSKHCGVTGKKAVARCNACQKEECEEECLALTLIGAVLIEKAHKV